MSFFNLAKIEIHVFWAFVACKNESHVFWGFFISDVEWSVFFQKTRWFFSWKKTVFFSMVFFSKRLFLHSFFSKLIFLIKHPTRYDFIFFFSLIDLTSIQALGRKKCWRLRNERRRTLFWNCLAWRLNQFDSTSLSPTFTWALSWPSMPSRYI